MTLHQDLVGFSAENGYGVNPSETRYGINCVKRTRRVVMVMGVELRKSISSIRKCLKHVKGSVNECAVCACPIKNRGIKTCKGPIEPQVAFVDSSGAVLSIWLQFYGAFIVLSFLEAECRRVLFPLSGSAEGACDGIAHGDDMLSYNLVRRFEGR
jgi:hypothetical protein